MPLASCTPSNHVMAQMISPRTLLLAFAIAATPLASFAATRQPDAEHARLATMAGRLNVVQTMWASPGKAPQVDRGSALISPVLNGSRLRQELHIDAKDKPFDGLGYIGYDNASHEYYSTWMDINFPGLIVATGGYDAAGASYVFRATLADGANPGTKIGLREVLHAIDANHFSYEYHEDRGKGEALAVRLEYIRAD